MKINSGDLQLHANALEKSELIYWGKLYDRSLLDLCPEKYKFKGALACVHPTLPILAMNRVIGWGWDQHTSALDLSHFIDYYQSKGCHRFMVQLSPLSPHYKQLVWWLKEYGFKYHNRWAKLWRPIDGYLPEVNSFFSLVRIGAEQALQFGHIIKTGFGWDYPEIEKWLAQGVGSTGYQHFLVYNDAQAIAAGALHIDGNYASMAFAATLPKFRGMGAQSLLLYHRIQEARRLGARYLVSETAEDRSDHPVTSFRNMQKFGFDLAYYRDNWLWES